MKIRRWCAFFIGLILLFQTMMINAEEREWYELQEDTIQEEIQIKEETTEISPYTLYIAGATVTLLKKSDSKVSMRSEVFCSETMKKIETVFELQKKSGNSWITVGTGTVSESNSTSLYKSMSASGVSSGTYRCIASSKATSYSGYAETVSVVSGSVKV